MKELPGQTPEGVASPLQKAIDRFQRQVTAPRFRGDTLRRTLESIQRAGTRTHASPGELYASLANLSGQAAAAAEQHGQTADQQSFAQQQERFQQASQSLAPEGGTPPQPSAPSRPQRTTGVASG